MNYSIKRHCLFLGLLLVYLIQSKTLFAQTDYSICGEVLSSNSSEPIPGVQVFIDGSMIGTTTNQNGEFLLKNVPIGKHQLAIHSIGYRSEVIDLSGSEVGTCLTISLKEKIYELNEIVVKPDRKDWETNFEQFRNIFIGQGPFSRNTKIENEEILNFYYDVSLNRLEAYAHERIVIKNNDLGYLIYFYLEAFEINYKMKKSYFAGNIFFEEMKSRRKRTKHKWQANRNKAYFGSFLHFTHSLINNSLSTEGFQVRYERKEDGARYITKDTIPEFYYFNKVDSLEYTLKFEDYLNVTYLNEKEDISYLEYIANPFRNDNRSLPNNQNSSFTLKADSVSLDRFGHIEDPKAIMFEGYWGFEKLSDMLPISFRPIEQN